MCRNALAESSFIILMLHQSIPLFFPLCFSHFTCLVHPRTGDFIIIFAFCLQVFSCLSLVLPFVDLGGFRPLALSISQSALSAVAHLLFSFFHPCAWCVGFLPSPLLRPPPRTVYRAVEYTLHSLDSFNFLLFCLFNLFSLFSSLHFQWFFTFKTNYAALVFSTVEIWLIRQI